LEDFKSKLRKWILGKHGTKENFKINGERLMISGLLYASVLTLGIFLVHKFTREKPVNPMLWVALFLTFLGIHLALRSKVEASQVQSYYIVRHPCREEIEFLELFKIGRECVLTYDQRQKYEQRRDYNRRQAKICFDRAKEICWYLPDIDDQRKAQYCLTAAGAAAYPGAPQSKMIGVIITTMVNYGLDCMAEWNQLQTTLLDAKSYYEMAEWYDEVLRKG
jgi:hypothetical protein